MNMHTITLNFRLTSQAKQHQITEEQINDKQ